MSNPLILLWCVMRKYLWILLPLLICGCSISTVRDSKETVGTFKCGDDAYLKFEKSLRTYRNRLEGVSGDLYDTSLWYCSKDSECVLMDKQNKPTPEYTSVLYQDDSLYNAFNTDESYKKLNKTDKAYMSGRPGLEVYKKRDKSWDVFVNPDVFSVTQYKEIQATLESNLEEINQLLSKRMAGGLGDKLKGSEPFN